MKLVVVVGALLAVVIAAPLDDRQLAEENAAPARGASTITLLKLSDPNRLNADEFMLRDELGQASFGYAHPEQTAVNYRDAFGNQVGSYAYINPEGKEIRVSYTADSRGRGVLSNDLAVGPSADLVAPEPVQDTAEVAEAEAAHTAAVAVARSGNHPAAPVMTAKDPWITTKVALARKEQMLWQELTAWAAAKAAAEAAIHAYRPCPRIFYT